ncbi:type I restriction endonuclease subunit R, partial [Micrococcus luteus]|nr:type I restriction endonuclease subunit R [Micrococcus luteus]
ANEDLEAVGQLPDEGFNMTRLQSSDKEFLSDVIADYNAQFKTNYSIDGRSFEDYYKDVAKRVRERDIDLLIVVGMFLTGFDAPTLNTLFVDKNLRYHGLIQAFSRTNRIYNSTKAFGNIVTFRDLEQNTIDALVLFGDKNAKNIVLERSFDEYMFGFEDPLTG